MQSLPGVTCQPESRVTTVMKILKKVMANAQGRQEQRGSREEASIPRGGNTGSENCPNWDPLGSLDTLLQWLWSGVGRGAATW